MNGKLLRAVLAAAVVSAIALVWVNSRILMMRRNAAGGRPVVLSGYYVYHGMAEALREGRVGQFDMTALRAYSALNDPLAPYTRTPPGTAQDWRHFYTLDIGYLFIVELARLAFPTLPDNILRALALQFTADALLVVALYAFFSQSSAATGAAAALLYSANAVFTTLVSIAYYSYWDIPLTFIVTGAVAIALKGPQRSAVAVFVLGVALGCGVWLRGTWWPLALFTFAVVGSVQRLRRQLVPAVVAFCLIVAPQVARSSVARGGPTLSTRAVWHVALVGLGYYPNPYGLEPTDESVFKLTREKYGIEFRSEDYYVHDQAARQEFFAILRSNPRFVVTSIFGRLKESVMGTTKDSQPSYVGFPNGLYRLLCLGGLLMMLARGGDARVLGLLVLGMYAIYVTATCAFFFVGVAYDNVSQVMMFVALLGGLEPLLRLLAQEFE
jgi:hypothetical protein